MSTNIERRLSKFDSPAKTPFKCIDVVSAIGMFLTFTTTAS